MFTPAVWVNASFTRALIGEGHVALCMQRHSAVTLLEGAVCAYCGHTPGVCQAPHALLYRCVWQPVSLTSLHPRTPTSLLTALCQQTGQSCCLVPVDTTSRLLSSGSSGSPTPHLCSSLSVVCAQMALFVSTQCDLRLWCLTITPKCLPLICLTWRTLKLKNDPWSISFSDVNIISMYSQASDWSSLQASVAECSASLCQSQHIHLAA